MFKYLTSFSLRWILLLDYPPPFSYVIFSFIEFPFLFLKNVTSTNFLGIKFGNFHDLKRLTPLQNANFLKESPEAQVKNSLFFRNVMFRSRYSNFCIFHHPMIYQIGDAMSISKDNFQDFLNNLEDWG